MLVVTDVQIVDIDKNSYEFFKYKPVLWGRVMEGEMPTEETVKVKRELIEGERYILPTGRQLIIGLSERVRNALGIPLQVWNLMKNQNEEFRLFQVRLLQANTKYQQDIKKYETLSFRGRLKFLFRGRI